MGTWFVSSVFEGTTNATCSLPSLSGGGSVKYTSKPKQTHKTRRSQERLVSLPRQEGGGKREKAPKNESSARYVSRSVPVHSARHNNEDRESNSAPGHTDHNHANRHHTNHDRQQHRTGMPRLPKINNLLNEPLQQQVHGTPTKATRREPGGKRWASSWADARANTSTKEDSRGTASNYYHHPWPCSDRKSPEKPPPVKSFSTRVSDGTSRKSCKETAAEVVPVKESTVKRTEIPNPDTKGTQEESRSKTSPATKESQLKTDMRSQSTSLINTKVTKTLPNQSKSSTILTSQVPIQQNTQGKVPRQNSEGAQSTSSSLREIPEITVKTDSRGSQSTTTTTTQGRAVKQKKRPFRKPVIITKKSLVKQKTLTSIYGNRTFKGQRQIRVLQKMEEVQRKEVEEYNSDLRVKEKNRMESVVRQRMALKRVRDRFDEEQVRRFRHQYVSWRSVEEDRLNRSSEAYGLPDFIYEDRYEKTLKKIPEGQTTTSGKKKPKKFKQYASWVRNIKVFEMLLNPKVSGNMEEAFKQNRKTIVEGIDTVKLDNDDSSKRAKKVNVKRLIGSAKKLLSVTDATDNISEVSSYDGEDDEDDSSLDLSEDDEDET